MAKIPSYFATEQMETSRLPRAPMGIADVGQGLEAQAIAGLGWELGRVGQLLGNIEAERQRGRDNVALAEMKGTLDDFEFNSRPDPTQFKEIADFAKAEEKYGKDWKKESQRSYRWFSGVEMQYLYLGLYASILKVKRLGKMY